VTINELIAALQGFDGELSVMTVADEFMVFHDVEAPREIELVKGDMFFSEDGTYWVRKEEDMTTLDEHKAVVTEAKKVVWL